MSLSFFLFLFDHFHHLAPLRARIVQGRKMIKFLLYFISKRPRVDASVSVSTSHTSMGGRQLHCVVTFLQRQLGVMEGAWVWRPVRPVLAKCVLSESPPLSSSSLGDDREGVSGFLCSVSFPPLPVAQSFLLLHHKSSSTYMVKKNKTVQKGPFSWLLLLLLHRKLRTLSVWCRTSSRRKENVCSRAEVSPHV